MIDHLWQSTAFAMCIAITAFYLRRNRASVRYSLWFSASIKFLVPFAILSSLGRQVEPIAPALPHNVATTFQDATQPFSGEFSFASIPAIQTDWTVWIIAFWACGALGITAARLRSWLRIRAIIRASQKTELRLPVEVRTSPSLIEPGIAGIWRPILLLPAGLREHLPPQRFDALLAHELEHVRRRDNLLSLVHMVVETIFWFHPFVWWIGSRLMEERERTCDEAVLAQGTDPADYAEAIMVVCRRYVESPLPCISGITGADLKIRIEAIYRQQDIFHLTRLRKLLLTATALTIASIPFLAGIATAQSDKSFEVASIRLVDSSRVGPGPAPGPSKGTVVPPGAPPSAQLSGTFSFSQTTYVLLLRAFQLQVCADAVNGGDCPRLVGGPDWMRNEAYAIQAKLPAGTQDYTQFQFMNGQAPEINAMLLNLFRERFALKTHRESRDLPALALTVNRGGHKLKPTQGKMEAAPDGTQQPMTRPVRIGMFTAPNGVPMVRLAVVNQSMHEVAEGLSFFLNQPVVDRTGLSGKFDFEIEYEADRDNPSLSAQPRNPALFTAFPEQAGVHLESTRAPVEVIVVDSIQRPSEN